MDTYSSQRQIIVVAQRVCFSLQRKDSNVNEGKSETRETLQVQSSYLHARWPLLSSEDYEQSPKCLQAQEYCCSNPEAIAIHRINHFPMILETTPPVLLQSTALYLTSTNRTEYNTRCKECSLRVNQPKPRNPLDNFPDLYCTSYKHPATITQETSLENTPVDVLLSCLKAAKEWEQSKANLKPCFQTPDSVIPYHLCMWFFLGLPDRCIFLRSSRSLQPADHS